MKKTSLLLLTLCLGLALTGCEQERVETLPPTAVKTQVVVFENPYEHAVYPGTVKGRYENRLSFQVSGKILSRNVDRGSVVKRDDLLLEIDPKDIAENVRMAKARLSAARSSLALAKSDFERYEQLYQKNTVSQSLYDSYRTAYDTAAGTFEQADAQYTQSLNELSYCRLTAQADGVISSVEVEAGQVVGAGQMVAMLVETKELEVEITVPERRISALSPGHRATVVFWALPDVRLAGFVREISPVADPVTRTYQVRLQLPAVPAELQLGMTASAEIDLGGRDSAPVARLPIAAVLQAFDQPEVLVVQQDKLESRRVSLGGFEKNEVLVTSGLLEGDLVVVAGIHKLNEGQAVRVLPKGSW